MEKTYNNYKFAKLHLINKYKKYYTKLARSVTDVNTFVSINDFLAYEPCLGPEEEIGIIYYHYALIENSNDFMKILINDIYYNNIVCILDFPSKHKNFLSQNTLNYNSSLDYLDIPISMIEDIKKCFNENKRFTYINLRHYWDKVEFGHANMILIDNINKTIERFEPYGKSILNDKKNIVSTKIDNKFSDDVLNKIGLINYKYISPINYNPVVGLQTKADAYEGMCATFSMIYLHLRLMNPDIDQKILIKYLLSKKKDEIIDIILKYARYIENSLKENSYLLNIERNKFYITNFEKKQDYLRIKNKGLEIINY